MSGKSARAVAVQLVYGCRDDALLQLTPERLVASYGLKLPEATELLAKAKRERGVADG